VSGEGQGQRHSGVGERVSGILNAAEAAAEQIRQDARQAAAEIIRQAEAVAAAREHELEVEFDRARARAEDEVRDLRLAVESYASRRRADADEEARQRISDAETQARATREAAAQMARELEEGAQQRHQEVRAQTRALEKQRDRTLEELRRIAAQLEEFLPAPAPPPRTEETLSEVLSVDSRRAGRRRRLSGSP
jgi:hypothetical protein